MHELSVCKALVNEVLRIAMQCDAVWVTGVRLRVGPLSGVVPALLAHAYPIAVAGTCAEGSLLAIDETPIRVRCAECGLETDTQMSRLLCAVCNSTQVALVSGDELLLESVELQLARVSDEVMEADHV